MQAVLLANGGLRSILHVFFPAKSLIQEKDCRFISALPLRRGQLQWPNSTIIRSEGSRRRRPQQRSVSSDKPREGGSEELKRRSKSPDNKEILALFRRIQSSISKEGEAKVPRRRNEITDSDSPQRNPSRGRTNEKGRRRGSGLEDAAAVEEDSKTQRPLSKFVRRSPIPISLPSDEQSLLNKEDELEKAQKLEGTEENKAGSEVFEMEKIDDMKVSELKELARGKGIKGFSKLKKGELLQLLKERLKPVS
ncbi:rho-N domain-containing protein 1, chloroplastic [Dendrobium catenatum]|uniref:rho-N domain-containing protein 1, chloroplastic n=1 Tax=Dendrobium catenatum TaxID=906689 RepID=UPI0009F59A29|nr:rho-N domain-containing protein 1, chloroplastic [Dendrobium catenatum]